MASQIVDKVPRKKSVKKIRKEFIKNKKEGGIHFILK